jgi:RNA polymerase sigma factor (sigma-70 family)
VSERLSYEDLAEIVYAHADALLLFARQRSEALAEDVVQEAFLQLVRRVKANDPPENVVAWLYRVTRNELITRHHGRRRRRAREARVASERPGWFQQSSDAVRLPYVQMLLENEASLTPLERALLHQLDQESSHGRR